MGQGPLDVGGQGFRVEVTLVPLLGHRGGTHRIEFPESVGSTSRARGVGDSLMRCRRSWIERRGERCLTATPSACAACGSGFASGAGTLVS